MAIPVFSKDWKVIKPGNNYTTPKNFLCDEEGIIGLIKKEEDALLASLAPKMYLIIRNLLFLSRLHGYNKLLSGNQKDMEEIVIALEGGEKEEVYCP